MLTLIIVKHYHTNTTLILYVDTLNMDDILLYTDPNLGPYVHDLILFRTSL